MFKYISLLLMAVFFLSSALQAEKIVFSVIPSSTSKTLLNKWTPFITYISNELSIDVSLDFSANYEELLNKIVEGRIDFYLLGSFLYLEARKQVPIEIIAQRVKKSPAYYSIIAVHKDSPFKSVSDLEKKSVAFTDKSSTSGYVLPRIMMSEKGITNPDNFFSRIVWAGNHENSIYLLANKVVDVSCFSSTRWEKKSDILEKKRRDLRIIHKSEKVPLGPLCCNSSLNPELKKILRNAVLSISIDSSDTSDLAKSLEVSGFIEGDDENYRQIEKYAEMLKKISSEEKP